MVGWMSNFFSSLTDFTPLPGRTRRSGPSKHLLDRGNRASACAITPVSISNLPITGCRSSLRHHHDGTECSSSSWGPVTRARPSKG